MNIWKRLPIGLLLVSGLAKAQTLPTVPVYTYAVPDGGYSPNGNLMNYTDSVTGTWSTQYDSLNRLTSANVSAGQYQGLNLQWGYDSFGNRLNQTPSGTSSQPVPSATSATYNAKNQVQTSSIPGVGPGSYDAAGNLTFDGLNTMAYDAENRICAVQNSASAITQYLYNAEGQRVAKGYPRDGLLACPAAGNFVVTETYILGPGGEQVTQMDGTGHWQHTNVSAAGQLLATYDQEGNQQLLHFNISDALGTKRVQASATGATEISYSSLPFGDGLTPSGAGQDATEHHFTGKERDTESGLDYFGARYYASNMGRWMSPDWSGAGDPVPYASLENPQTLNLYAYVQNNPLSRTDPFGHASDPCNGNKDTCVTVTAEPDNGPGLITLGLAWGHHFVDRAVVAEQNAQNSLAGKFFSRWRTGPLKPGGVHTGFPKAARLSQDQVRKIVNDVVNRSGKTMSEWGQAEINEAVEEVRNAGGDTGAFLNSIAQENPGVRTAQADVQDVMNAAKSAMDTIKANANPAAIEEDVKDIIVTCEEGGCPPP